MKELSDWQAARVRDALRAYHRYGRGSDGRYFTWKDVREAIAVYTGAEIGSSPRHGGERLRQFVEGVADRNNPDIIKYPAPQPMESIVAFVTDGELQLLSEEELKEFVPSFQAPMRLLEYLDWRANKGRLMPPSRLDGRYRWSEHRGDHIVVRELVLQRALESGIIQVIQVEEIYNPSISLDELNDLAPRAVAEARIIRYHYGGWAVLTPEFNLFFFLKEEKKGINRYYIGLGSDLTSRTEEPVKTLILLFHNMPFEPERGKPLSFPEMLVEIKSEFSKKMLPFLRII